MNAQDQQQADLPGRRLPAGAHLVTERNGYAHHGIYAGNGRVIHYAGFCHALHAGPVEETTLEQFATATASPSRPSRAPATSAPKPCVAPAAAWAKTLPPADQQLRALLHVVPAGPGAQRTGGNMPASSAAAMVTVLQLVRALLSPTNGHTGLNAA
jgi:hypothetical protein